MPRPPPAGSSPPPAPVRSAARFPGIRHSGSFKNRHERPPRRGKLNRLQQPDLALFVNYRFDRPDHFPVRLCSLAPRGYRRGSSTIAIWRWATPGGGRGVRTPGPASMPFGVQRDPARCGSGRELFRGRQPVQPGSITALLAADACGVLPHRPDPWHGRCFPYCGATPRGR